MNNPWLKLPDTAPFVLPEDAASISAFNRAAKPDVFIHLDLFPEPFIGNPYAPVVLLGLNPGFSPYDIDHHTNHHFAMLSRQNLSHISESYPFYLLNPSLGAPGRTWWETKLSRLIQAKGREVVARKIFCVEYFPYHSRRFAHTKIVVPSQAYSIFLVQEALNRNAIVIVLRSEKLWCTAIPELATYPQLYRLRSVQNVMLTLNNCPEGYNAILEVL